MPAGSHVRCRQVPSPVLPESPAAPPRGDPLPPSRPRRPAPTCGAARFHPRPLPERSLVQSRAPNVRGVG